VRRLKEYAAKKTRLDCALPTIFHIINLNKEKKETTLN